MKRVLILLPLLLLFFSNGYGQCLSVINNSKSKPFSYYAPHNYYYLAGGFDLNNSMNLDKTDMEPQGFDFDIELGVRKELVSYYGYYGEYNKISYRNYGLGMDYYFLNGYVFDMSVGFNVGGIDITDDVDPTYLAYAGRLRGVYDVSEIFGVYMVGQYQQRPDRMIHGIFEVSLGVQIKI